jgi:hypothetical protein
MKYLKSLITLFVSICIGVSLNAQVSLSAGMGSIRGFSSENSFFGLHGGLELPRNNDVTFYGRFGHYFSRVNKETEQTVTVYKQDLTIPDDVLPYNIQVPLSRSMNYTTFEGGTRYYIGNDYDNGFSGYGGTNFMLLFNTVKESYGDSFTDPWGVITDENYTWQNDYSPDSFGNNSSDERGRIISLALGLQGGLKYTIPAIGTAYFDISGQYAVLALANNSIAEQEFTSNGQFSQLFFVFTVGFRKDLY